MREFVVVEKKSDIALESRRVSLSAKYAHVEVIECRCALLESSRGDCS